MCPEPGATATPPFKTVAVFGPGLLGGSIAKAVQRNLPGCTLRLWARREQPLELARRLGITQETYLDARAAAEGADLLILATPIGAFEELARRMLPGIPPEAVVTDVGSVKAYVHRTTGCMLTERGRVFIGSHPMAGAETQGLENARAELLQGATVALTNPHGASQQQVDRLRAFWQALGCSTYAMGPEEHDQTVARISHMPHILAGLAARNAAGESCGSPESGTCPPNTAHLRRLASSGFRDTTRVCTGGPAMWADILWENDVAIRRVLHECVHDLHHLIHLLETQDKESVRQWLEDARAAKLSIMP